jgi:hypothetical protein
VYPAANSSRFNGFPLFIKSLKRLDIVRHFSTTPG